MKQKQNIGLYKQIRKYKKLSGFETRNAEKDSFPQEILTKCLYLRRRRRRNAEKDTSP